MTGSSELQNSITAALRLSTYIAMSSLRGAQGKHIGGGRPSGRACARGRKAPCQRAYALILPPLNWHRVAARHDAFVGIMKDQCWRQRLGWHLVRPYITPHSPLLAPLGRAKKEPFLTHFLGPVMVHGWLRYGQNTSSDTRQTSLIQRKLFGDGHD
eukprot:1141529-Pelagomonas_calceolata.AAC.4